MKLSPQELNLEDRKLQFEVACKDGSSEACHSLAEFFQVIEENERKALDLFKSNCDPPTESGKRRSSII